MGYKRTSGLFKRQEIWHIDKQIFGCRIRESTGAHSVAEAEAILARRIEEIRQAKVFGVRPHHTLREATIRYIIEKQHKASVRMDISWLNLLNQYLGDTPLHLINMASLQPFIEARRKAKVKVRTINSALEILRHLLNLAASEWFDENGMLWLEQGPKIRLLKD